MMNGIRKFAKIFGLSVLTSLYRVFFVFINAKIDRTTASDRGMPPIEALIPMNASYAALIETAKLAVCAVLRSGRWAEVALSVVACVAIFMFAVQIRVREIQDKSVHHLAEQWRPVRSAGIVGLRRMAPVCVPINCIDTLKIVGIDHCDLFLGERNKFNRRIGRLNESRAFHSIFATRSRESSFGHDSNHKADAIA